MSFEIRTDLDLHDIQGNIVKGYGRYGFPKARYVFFRINSAECGCRFVFQLLPLITTAAPWTQYGSEEQGTKKPNVTTNVSFTFEGLKNLGVPAASLITFPEDFAMGMKARKEILGDNGPSAPENWDPIWKGTESEQPVHMLVTINGVDEEQVSDRYDQIRELLDHPDVKGGVTQLGGHVGDNGKDEAFQAASALYVNEKPSHKEHFGYDDGISDPYFKDSGSYPDYVIGHGKPTGGDPETHDGWEALATGEFILGHRDEGDEYPKAPMPPLLSRNGTFMVYRKLHENVGSFNDYLEDAGEEFPGGKEALAAKFVGRWRNGAPIAVFPTEAEADAFMKEYLEAGEALQVAKAGEDKQAIELARKKYYPLKLRLSAFDYRDDLNGSRCPAGAHTRRINPRGALEQGVEGAFDTPGALVNRRRILRRGLPYGEVTDPTDNDGNHGIIFMALNADIARQFEFVQQQWVNYGNDFNLANDKDPILGDHGKDEDEKPDGRMMIPSDSPGEKPPFFCKHIPRFVETRGGDYFFIPSLTALHMIGEGIVDPT